MTVFWVRQDGTINRATADDDPAPGPELRKVTTTPPIGGRDIWDGTKWIAAKPRPDKNDELAKAADAATTIAELKSVVIDVIKALK